MPQPKIIIVGGGFGGLAAAKALRNASAQILLIESNQHLREHTTKSNHDAVHP